MRRLFLAALGYALGTALCAYLLQGWPRYALLALLALLSTICVLLRFRRGFRQLAWILPAAALALMVCTCYDVYYLEPMQAAAESQTEYEGVVMSESAVYASGWKSVELSVKLAGRRTRAKVFYRTEEAFEPCEILRFSAALNWKEPGEDADNWYDIARGIRLSGWLPDEYSVSKPAHIPLRCVPARIAMRFRRTIRACMTGEPAALLCALITGDRTGVSSLLKDQMITAGIYHTLAVSGLHVSVLMGLLQRLLRRRKWLLALLGLPILALFVLMTGASPSAVRAAWMLALLLIAPLFRRESDPLTSLGFASLVILLLNPYAIASVSFQLSFCACLGIILFQERISSALTPKWSAPATGIRRFGRRILQGAIGIVSVTLAAQITTLPVSVWYFGQLSLVAPLTNLLTSLAVTALLAVGLLLVLLGTLFLPAGMLLAIPATGLAKYVIWVTRLMCALPFAKLYTTSPYLLLFLGFLYFLLALILLAKLPVRPWIPVCCAAIMLCACLLLNALTYDLSEFTFFALDVGQGQSLLLCSDGVSALIDCGGSNALTAARTAEKYLSTVGASKLDVLILTHYDTDHAGGVIPLLERVKTERIIAPDVADDSGNRAEIEAYAEAHGIEFYLIDTRAAQLGFGNGTLTVYPPVSYLSDNEACLTVLASFGDYDILATGDISISAERLLLQWYELPDIELLVAGHHGSRNATSMELLQATRPELVVISVGENSYGHPSPETLARIEASGAAVLRTDRSGTITIRR